MNHLVFHHSSLVSRAAWEMPLLPVPDHGGSEANTTGAATGGTDGQRGLRDWNMGSSAGISWRLYGYIMIYIYIVIGDYNMG